MATLWSIFRFPLNFKHIIFTQVFFVSMLSLCLGQSVKTRIDSRYSNSKAIDLVTTGLQVGDTVPDLTIENILYYKSSTSRLSDFKGQLLILDFWATWCSPCVAMMPKLDSLQKDFGNKVQFISVTYQSSEEVEAFLASRENSKNVPSVPIVTSDTILRNTFPHRTLPHIVLINKEGIVTGITEGSEITEESIKRALMGEFSVKIKKDVFKIYDHKQPLLIANNGGPGNEMVYHSLMSNYIEGVSSRYSYDADFHNSSTRLSLINMNLSWMYRIAYGEGVRWLGKNRIRYDVVDTSRLINDTSGSVYRNWLQSGNGYCYEVILPENDNKDVFQIMQQDLKRLLPQYSVNLSRRPTKCLALIRTSTTDKLKSSGETTQVDFSSSGCILRNAGIGYFVGRLDAFFLQNSQYPIVDETGYKDPVDIEIKANLSNISEINKELKKYDLKLEEGIYETDILSISDRK